jgi:hypothetical protein
VAHCTQHGACPEIIAQVVLLTYFIDSLKNFQDVELKGTDIVTCHKTIVICLNFVAKVRKKLHISIKTLVRLQIII